MALERDGLINYILSSMQWARLSVFCIISLCSHFLLIFYCLNTHLSLWIVLVISIANHNEWYQSIRLTQCIVFLFHSALYFKLYWWCWVYIEFIVSENYMVLHGEHLHQHLFSTTINDCYKYPWYVYLMKLCDYFFRILFKSRDMYMYMYMYNNLYVYIYTIIYMYIHTHIFKLLSSMAKPVYPFC